MNELDRQLFHINLGLSIILFFALFGRTYTQAFLSLSLILGVFLIHLKMRGTPIPLIDWFLARFERKGETPGYGSLWYFVGLLLLFTLVSDAASLAASSLILSVGDGLSTIVGIRFGKNRLPYNRKKTLEGTLAFFGSSSLFGFIFLGPMGIILAAVAAAAESFPLSLDDNLTVPIFSVLLLRLFGVG